MALLNASLPEDLQAQQWFARGDAQPLGEGAHRPWPIAAKEACQTFMGDPKAS